MKRKKLRGLEIIKFTGEKNCQSLGNINLEFNNVNPINKSFKGDLTFCNKKGEEAINILQETNASIILCHEDVLKYDIKLQNKLLIAVDNPRLWFIRCIQKFFPPIEKKGIHPTASIGENCKIGDEVYIGAYVCIGDNVKIGNRSKIYSGIHIYDNVSIGNHVVINSGCIIGAEGFGYERNENKIPEKFPHMESVRIENFVEIGANTCIDRGTLDDTLIGEGTKIDNLVHIGHNAKIGKHCIITAQCMIGRSIIGDYSYIAPCSCLRPGKNIGKESFIGLGAVVTKDVEDYDIVYGVPAKSKKESPK